MLILGHRGMPNSTTQENTLPSFMKALQGGADGIEFDIHLSKDNQIVLGHDKNLSRIAGTNHQINKMTAKELEKVPLRGEGKIVTLNSLINHLPDNILLDIEIKDSNATEPLIKKLKHSTKLRQRTIISSFDIKILFKIKESLPNTRTIFLLRAWPWRITHSKLWKQILLLEPWAIATRRNFITQKRIDWLHQNHILIGAYDDISYSRSTKNIINKNVDIAITFRPDLARKHLN